MAMDWTTFSDKFGDFGDKVGRSLKAFFGSRNERLIRTYEPLVARINQLEAWAKELSAEDFKKKTEEWRKALQGGAATLDDLLPEAFALVREASRRTLGLRHYDVQLVGGMV